MFLQLHCRNHTQHTRDRVDSGWGNGDSRGSKQEGWGWGLNKQNKAHMYCTYLI